MKHLNVDEKLNDYMVVMRNLLFHFEDWERAHVWMSVSNPGLGMLSPLEMIRIGRGKKLRRFVDDRLSENILEVVK